MGQPRLNYHRLHTSLHVRYVSPIHIVDSLRSNPRVRSVVRPKNREKNIVRIRSEALSVMDSLLTVLKTTPLNVLLLIPIGYLLCDVLFPRVLLAPGAPVPSSYEESYLWRPKAHMPVIVWKQYSPQTLEEFDGKRNPRILLAIDRVVYDVTAGKSFYGPGDSSNSIPV